MILQDNNSTILLANNGRRSSGKKTRHINIRYFFITDRLEKHQELTIKYCDTGNMVADYLSKPTQGRTYKKHRGFIVGDLWSDTDENVPMDHRSVLKSEHGCTSESDTWIGGEITSADQNNKNIKIITKRHLKMRCWDPYNNKRQDGEIEDEMGLTRTGLSVRPV